MRLSQNDKLIALVSFFSGIFKLDFKIKIMFIHLKLKFLFFNYYLVIFQLLFSNLYNLMHTLG